MLYTAYWSSGAMIQQITIHFVEQVNVSLAWFSFSHLDLSWRLKLSTLASLKVSKANLPKTNSIQEEVYPTRILTSLDFYTSHCNSLTSLQLLPWPLPMLSWMFLFLLRVTRQKVNSRKERGTEIFTSVFINEKLPPSFLCCSINLELLLSFCCPSFCLAALMRPWHGVFKLFGSVLAVPSQKCVWSHKTRPWVFGM